MTNDKMFDFIRKSPSPFHTVKEISEILKRNGFERLSESEEWNICPGKYYVVRGGTSVVAFTVPDEFEAFNICASHTDSPCFKIKPNSHISEGIYSKIDGEKYGGSILSTWLDRPLGIAGRIVRKTEDGIKYELVDTESDICIIPNVAPHLMRDTAMGKTYDMKCDMAAILGEKDAKLSDLFGEFEYGDLCLYIREAPTTLGINGEFIAAPRLDDLECVYTSLCALVDSSPKNAAVYCAFDSEEIGSSTMQGANSDFLLSVLGRISKAYGKDINALLASSFFLSCDNAHAIHPNHPELSDRENAPKLNGGVVIKHSASRSYTSEAASAAIFKSICENAGVPIQNYTNRSDILGGSTLGAIAMRHTSCLALDIGLAQLAMHSAYESAGSKDADYMERAVRAFYESKITVTEEGARIQ